MLVSENFLHEDYSDGSLKGINVNHLQGKIKRVKRHRGPQVRKGTNKVTSPSDRRPDKSILERLESLLNDIERGTPNEDPDVLIEESIKYIRGLDKHEPEKIKEKDDIQAIIDEIYEIQQKVMKCHS